MSIHSYPSITIMRHPEHGYAINGFKEWHRWMQRNSALYHHADASATETGMTEADHLRYLLYTMGTEAAQVRDLCLLMAKQGCRYPWEVIPESPAAS